MVGLEPFERSLQFLASAFLVSHFRLTGKKYLVAIESLKPDSHLKKFKQVPTGQLFADLWNLNTWYASDFIKELEKTLDKTLREGA